MTEADMILSGREKRRMVLQELFKAYTGAAAFTVSVNIPGNDKHVYPAKEIFSAALNQARDQVKRSDFPILESRVMDNRAGFYCIGVFQDEPGRLRLLKNSFAAIEETHPLGRIFDLDVLDQRGCPVRAENRGKRLCLMCEEQSFTCRRQGRHSTGDLVREIVKRYAGYSKVKFSNIPLKGQGI